MTKLKEKVIKKCTTYLKRKHPDRFSKKCERDLQLIYSAVIKDLDHKTLFYSTQIADYFFKDGKLLLSDTKAEIDTYNLMSSIMLKEGLDVRKSINNIKNIILNGSKLTPETNLATAAKNANYCQRNWDRSFKLPEEDVEVLTKIAEYMPSKQNIDYFNLLVSTDTEFNQWLFEAAILLGDENSYTRNSQVTAPLVFMYFETLSKKKFQRTNQSTSDEEMFRTVGSSIGISVGAVSLAANNMGYRTGFCQCLEGKKITDKLIEKHSLDFGTAPRLVLGIGKPNTNYSWNTVLDKEENFLKDIESVSKQHSKIINRIR